MGRELRQPPQADASAAEAARRPQGALCGRGPETLPVQKARPLLGQTALRRPPHDGAVIIAISALAYALTIYDEDWGSAAGAGERLLRGVVGTAAISWAALPIFQSHPAAREGAERPQFSRASSRTCSASAPARASSSSGSISRSAALAIAVGRSSSRSARSATCSSTAWAVSCAQRQVRSQPRPAGVEQPLRLARVDDERAVELLVGEVEAPPVADDADRDAGGAGDPGARDRERRRVALAGRERVRQQQGPAGPGGQVLGQQPAEPVQLGGGVVRAGSRRASAASRACTHRPSAWPSSRASSSDSAAWSVQGVAARRADSVTGARSTRR